MEQTAQTTQTASNAVATINQEQFGNLITIPNVLQQNQSLAQRAMATCTQTVAELRKIDLTAVSVEVMEKHDAELNQLQVKLKDAYTIMQDRRKPFTQFFDEIKAMFTKCEGDVVNVGKEVKDLRDAWQKEKARRAAIIEQQRQAELAKKQEEIECRTYAKNCINQAFTKALSETIEKMNNAFNAQTVESFGEYEVKLKKYVPALSSEAFTALIPSVNAKPQHYTYEQAQIMYREEAEVLKASLTKEWAERLSAERDRLIELIPSRKRELERIATDAQAAKEAAERIAREQAERKAQLEAEAKEREAANQQAAEVETMNVAFDEAAKAAPIVGMTKGTVVKKKYVVKSHKAWAAIIQSWVVNDMVKMTPEELQKKLSFMKTACEGRLNKGEEIKAEGLEIEEDYSTRATRKAS